MKQILKKLNTKREGATLVTVVIATAFLIAIGVVILAASSKYLVSVYMDRNSNENLYSAEGILSEVRSGLLEYASESGAAAYKEIMEDYNKVFTKTDPNDMTKKLVLSKRDRFAQMYIEGIVDKIAPSDYVWDEANVNAASTPEDETKIAAEVSADNLYKLTKRSQSESENKDKNGDKIVTSGNDLKKDEFGPEKLCCSIWYSTSKGYYLLIHNLGINYLDESGYRSTIQTDIQMTVPDYNFDGGTTPEATNRFLLISDGQLHVGEAGSTTATDTSPAAFSGNIYTGGYVGSTGAGGDVVDDASAILVEPNVTAHFNCDLLISRGSLEAKTGSHVKITGQKMVTTEGGAPTESMKGEVYLKNILLTPSVAQAVAPAPADGAGTQFTLKATSYIENDLDIRDAGTTVTLGGWYRGYSYSKENGDDLSDVTTAKSQSDYSSAILINGMGTTLKAENLNELFLAGRTFVKRTGSYEDYNDIMMGESVAVKTNQIAYMVPDKYVRRKHNPLMQSEANNWDGSDYFDPQSLVNTEDLKSDFKLGEECLLDENHPVTANYKPAEGEGGTPYVFLFLNFKDQNAANNYFREFYNGTYISEPEPDEEDEGAGQPGDVTKKDLLSRAKAYIVSEDGDITLDPSYYLVAGYIIHHYVDENGNPHDLMSPDKFYEGYGNPNSQFLTNLGKGRDYGYKYVSLQKTLTPSETETSMRLIPSKKNFKDRAIGEGNTRDVVPPVADGKVIKFGEIVPCGPKQEPLTGATVYSGDADLSTSSYLGEDGRLLLVSKENITIDADCSGLIIGKNIRIEAGKSFKGLIIASGDVTVAGNCNLESDQVLVKKLMTYAKGDPDLSKMFGLDNPDTHNSAVPDECCRYQNWIKNTY